MTAPLLPSPTAPSPEPHLTAAEIDRSCRLPLLLFAGAAVLWLTLGVLLLLICSIKLHGPGFLSGTAALTLGRLRPAAMNALLYGFACQAAFGMCLWMIARLGRVRLDNPGGIALAGVVWNLAVAFGFLGVLGGASTGFQWLEMPRFVVPVLFAAYAVIGGAALLTFRARRTPALYVSQWYLLAALFWFPWIFSAASLLLLYLPVRGVLQAAVGAWYRSNLLELWLTPVGLAALFYFIPKITGRPLYSRGLALLGFWTQALFGACVGFTQLLGGPLPAWMLSASIACGFVLLVPILCVAINVIATLCRGRDCRLDFRDPALRYILFGAACYLVASLEGVVLGTRSVSVVTRFTYVEPARTLLTVLGFFGMTALGAIHYVVPRIAQVAWPSGRLQRAHFGCSALGLGVVFLALTGAGLVQGLRLGDPAVPMVQVIKATVPWLGLATLGWLLLLAGQVALVIHLGRLLVQVCAPRIQSVLAWLKRAATSETEVQA